MSNIQVNWEEWEFFEKLVRSVDLLDRVAALEDSIKELNSHVELLIARVDDLEDRPRIMTDEEIHEYSIVKDQQARQAELEE